jgi:hypothetical protein
MPRSKNLKPNVFYDCAVCGEAVARYVTPYQQRIEPMKYCGRKCAGAARRGAAHPMWIGGRVQDGNGYILVYQPDHPHARAQGYVYEHRLVMEKKLGRYLAPEEVVHHMNSDAQDNSPENLAHFPNNAEHKRHEDAERARNQAGQYLSIGAA